MKQLYFVRHGQSEMNVAEQYAGHVDTPLTDRGREQAKLAGEAARELGINLIVASPLSRAQETAQIIAGIIDYPVDTITTDAIFIEQDYGTLAGLPWTTLNPESYEGQETFDQLIVRAEKALKFLQSLPEDNVLVVGHGSFYVALAGLLRPGEVIPEPENATVVKLI